MILAVGVFVVGLLRKIGLPSIAGFVVAGILIGPGSLGLIRHVEHVDRLAEIGVVLLLFGIGLELSIEKLRRLWKLIVIGGGLQMGICLLVSYALARAAEVAPAQAVFLSFLVAGSSTAIVLRGLSARGELEAPHGKLTLGILVFQDLCVVPMMLLLPMLGGQWHSPLQPLWALTKAFGLLALVLCGSLLLVPKALHFAAQARQRDLFVMAMLLVCAGMAWLAAKLGLSVALGAFLAGIVVASSDYRHQALADLIPFREVFTSIFFISVGMLFDPILLFESPIAVCVLLLGILAVKFVTMFAAAAFLRLPVRVVVLAATALAQVGEFSFVLVHAAKPFGLHAMWFMPELEAAIILSMMITPIALVFGPHLAAGVGKIKILTRLLDVRTSDDMAERGEQLDHHVIIAGYGVTGQELSYALKTCGISYVILEMNPETVRRAVKRGEPAFYGDISSPEVQQHVRLKQARELILVINDPGAAIRAIKAAREIAPELSIIVKARYVGDVERLLLAGASDVVPAEIEAAVELTFRVLMRHRIDSTFISGQLSRIRRRQQDDLKNQDVGAHESEPTPIVLADRV